MSQQEQLELDGRVVVVTGASSGIGLAVAELAHERGAEVVLLARRAELLGEVTSRLGKRATAIVTDVSDPDSVRAAFAQIDGAFGRVDVLANVSGVMRYRRLEENSDDDIGAVLGASLLGTIYASRAAVPLLRAAGGGDILNFGSEVTHLYLPGSSIYSAAKAGIARFSDVLGRELRPDGIRVTEIVVGYTATGASALIPAEDRDRIRPALIESAYQNFSGSTPMSARSVAEVALFPASRPRGQYIGVIHARSMR
jgi:NAD(P)-dependent dehydrogenase (short-subunit alcohol dehydrogenase family)